MTMFDMDQGDPGDGWQPDPAMLPAGLEEVSPDWFTHALAADIDRTRLSGHDLIRLLQAEDRLVSHLQARRATTMAALGETTGWDEHTSSEIAAALHLTTRAGDLEFGTACQLHLLPHVRDLLADGRLDWRRAVAVVNAVMHLDTDTAQRVVEAVADRLPALTTGQIGALIRKTCLSLDADDATKRLEQRLVERRVDVYPQPEGTANLVLADIAPDKAAAAMAHIDALARHLPTDGRTADQKRADVALDLLCGHGAPVGRGVVDITVDLTTLLGLEENPGTVGGWGPVTAEITRTIVNTQPDVPWQATITMPDGTVQTTALRRRPTADQARTVRARHATCVFPGCRMPARATDLDHTVDFQHGGPTIPENLAPLCRRHHRMKHETAWTYRVDDDGVHWTSPTGHTYTNPTRGP